MKKAAVAACALLLGACASKSSDISASYVSPLQYQPYTCDQLAQEAERVSQRAAELSGTQDSKATKDAVVTTVGVIVFWPALFALSGDGNTAAELGRLKGEMETIERVAVQKKCKIEFHRPAAQGKATS